MAEQEKEAYLALIAAQDPQIRALLDQGFAFVTNAFKAGAAPSGMQARTERDHVRRLSQAGYQVAVSAAYDGVPVVLEQFSEAFHNCSLASAPSKARLCQSGAGSDPRKPWPGTGYRVLRRRQ